MDASQELAFDQLCSDQSKRLWPGTIRLNGKGYEVTLTRDPIHVSFNDGEQAGVHEVDGIQVELSKCDHPDEPAVDALVQDLKTLKLYRIKRVGGRGDTDSDWYLSCPIDDRG